MKNRILSIILTLLMLVSAVSMFALPAAAATGFEIEPVVLIGGDGMYNIVWKSSSATQGRIEYTYAGKKYTVYDEEGGVVRPADRYHSIRVPQEHLDSLYEGNNKGSATSYTLYSGSNKFVVTGFDGYRGESSLDIGFFSDIHYSHNYASQHTDSKFQLSTLLTKVKNLVGKMGAPQIRAFVGDITDSLVYEQDVDALLKILSAAGQDGAGNAGHYPVLYSMGNHEKRGKFLHDVDDHISFSTGEMYGYFEFGPMAAFVTDIGEDKLDSNSSYTASATDPIGTIDMERYYREEYEYFKSHKGYNTNKTYTFTISHAPVYIGYSYGSATSGSFVNMFKAFGADLHVFGHWHNQTFYEDGIAKDTTQTDATKRPNHSIGYPGINVASDGKYNTSERCVLMTMAGGKYTIKAMDTDGNATWTRTVNANANGTPSVKEEVEEVLPSEEDNGYTPPSATTIPTDAAISTGEIKAAASTAAASSNAVVFDAGLYYNVVWQTSTASAGYVDVSDNGKTFMDHYGGVIRGYSTVHSVRVPKADLDGKAFMIKNRTIATYNAHGYGYVDPDTNQFVNNESPLKFNAYSYGSLIQFRKAPSAAGDEYNILAVGNKANYLTTNDAKAVAASYGELPDLVVFAGSNISAINNESDFVRFLTYASTLTGARCPVMFLRGEGETTGSYAANIPAIVHNMSSAYTLNKMYTTSKTGVLSVIGLDSGDNTASDVFANIRAEQSNWLANDLTSNFAGNYNIAFSDEYWNAFANHFAKHKVQLFVTADNGEKTAFYNQGSTFARAIIGTTGALAITCANNKIEVKSVSGSGMTTLGTVDVGKVTYATARVGDRYYTSVEEAMSVAKSGETVTLDGNSTADMLVVRPGRTLDLNGHTLTVNLLSGFKGSNVVDTSEAKTGKLVANRGNVSLSQNNSQMSVYDATNGCYVFTTVSATAYGKNRYKYTASTNKYTTSPFFYAQGNANEREVAHAILGSNFANSGVEVKIRITWEDENKTFVSDQDFKYTADSAQEYIKTWAISASSGNEKYDTLFAVFSNAILTQGKNVKIYTVVTSDTGAEYISGETTIA